MRNRDLLSCANLSYNMWNSQGAEYSYCSLLVRTQTLFVVPKCYNLCMRLGIQSVIVQKCFFQIVPTLLSHNLLNWPWQAPSKLLLLSLHIICPTSVDRVMQNLQLKQRVYTLIHPKEMHTRSRDNVVCIAIRLRAGRSGVRLPAEPRNLSLLQNVQNCARAQTADRFFSRIKRLGAPSRPLTAI
jgi:hypothetical protein